MKVTHPFSNPCKKLQAPLRLIKQSTFGFMVVLILLATLILHLIGATHVTTAGVSHAGTHAHSVTYSTPQFVDATPNEDPWPHP